MNGTSLSVSNIKGAVKNAVLSKLYFAFTICATVFTSLLTLSFIVSMIEAGKTGVFSDSVGIVEIVLAIIGTVGLWVLRNGYINDDFSTAVSGIKMSKCFIALEVIAIVIGYIASVIVLLAGLAFVAFDTLATGDIILEIEEALFEIGDPSLIEEFYEFLDAVPSFSIIGIVLIVAGVIVLAISILSSIHRRKLSKSVNSIKSLVLGKPESFKIPKFAYGFGYFIGVFIFISAFSTALPVSDDVFDIISFVLEVLCTAVESVAIFLFSLWLSSLKKKVDELPCVTPQPIVEADKIDSFFTFDGAKSDEKPADNTVTEENVENVTTQSFCGECGAKIKENSKFCSNCGSKII